MAATQKADVAELDEIEALEYVLPGVSVRAALERLAGNSRLYRNLLQSFAERRQDTPAKFRALSQSGDFEQLFLEAHNLKGESGNFGFDSINSAAGFLCQQIKSGQTTRVPEATEELARQCETILATLSRLADHDEGSEPVVACEEKRTLDLVQILPLFDQLASLLLSRNFGARRLSEEIDELTRGTELAGEWKEIMQAVQQLRYDSAQIALKELLDRHQWSAQ